MVCGEFGSPSLAPYNRGISILNAILAILAVCFGIVGCVSYTNKFDAIIAAPWILSENTTTKLWVASGIRSMAMYNIDDDKKKTAVVFPDLPLYTGDAPANPLTYEDCIDDPYLAYLVANGGQDQNARCKACKRASVTVVSFCSFALIGAAVAFVAHLLRYTCDSAFAKDIAIISGAGSFICGLVSYATFGKCARASRDYATLSGATGDWGIGAKLVLGSFTMAAIVTCITLITPVPAADQDEAEGEMVTKV